MRLLFIGGLMLILFFGGIGTLYAQDDDTTPMPDANTPATLQDLEEAVSRAEAAAAAAQQNMEQAEELVEQAGEALSLAGDMFGLFEAMSGAVGLVVPILVIVGGVIGFRRLESAQSELREAREKFERDVQLKEGQFDMLREELERAIQAQREDSGKASLALALLPVAERQYRAQDYSGALDTYGRALKLDKDNPIIHYRMGYVYTQSGDLTLAEQSLTRSLELDPDFAPAQAALGYVYRRMGDNLPANVERDITYNKAEENFLRALNSQPRLMDEDNESWWGALGGLYRRRGQVEQAIRAYERAAEVTPHSSYPYSNVALLSLQSGYRERAMQAYERVEKLAYGEVRADVDNYWAYADLIVSRLALGRINDVYEILDTGLRTAPVDSPYTLDSLIDTLVRLRDSVNPEERPPIQKVIEHIRNFKDRRDSQPGQFAEEIKTITQQTNTSSSP